MGSERTRSRRLLGAAALSLLLLTGCSGKKDGDGSSGDASDRPQASQARKTLEAVRRAYQELDMNGVMSHVDRNYYPDSSRLRRALMEDKERFSAFRLDFHVNQEISSDGHVLLKVRWNREQTSMATGIPAVAAGLAEFQFHRESGLLMDIRPRMGGMPLGFN